MLCNLISSRITRRINQHGSVVVPETVIDWVAAVPVENR
jgi:hypothetical protein